MKTREQREQRALGWSAVAGLGCTVLVGQMMSWSLPWWVWVIGFAIMTGAAFNGWQRSAAQSAVLDEQARREQDDPRGG
jgi:anti-sigma factor RsiW